MVSFTKKHVTTLGREIHRVGLAINYGIDERGFDRARERGLEYVFWTARRTSHLLPALKRAVAKDREKIVIATGPTIGYFGGNLRRFTEKKLHELGTDYIDVLHLFWLGATSALTDGTMDTLLALKAEGKIRTIGVSIHDRERAGQLVNDSKIELFMLRYNAAHPGAERDVFPHLSARKPAIVAYTATSWRKLLARPRGWSGGVMTAGDCYRFCLTNRHVDLVLMGPKSIEELDANLDAIEKGALSVEEEKWMRAFGANVHGGSAVRATEVGASSRSSRHE